MECRSLFGRRYILRERIAKGGEAEIYEIEGCGNAVAKIYNAALRTSHREQKLMTMLKIPIDAQLDSLLSWPKDILYDNRGRFAGFVMRRISGGALLEETYSDERLDIRKRLVVAKNLCVALYNIHKSGIVVGDLNPKNVLVLEGTGIVRIIDTDSFHISDGKRTFRCDVCVPEYISPKVSNAIPKGETLKSAPLPTYTRESDEYSLAILIFRLLMDGVHPFSVALAKGNGTDSLPQPAELMKRYCFPYAAAPRGTRLPVFALPFKLLTEELRQMFVKQFSGVGSISAEEWYEALCGLQDEVTKTCRANGQHKYRKGLRKCPYCETARKKEAFFKAQTKRRG